MAELHEMYDEAEQLKNSDKLDEAVAKFQEILAQDASYALAHSALAVVLQKQAKHEEAIEHAHKVCEIEPNDPFSFTALSVIYQRAFEGTQNTGYIQAAEEAMARSRMIQGM